MFGIEFDWFEQRKYHFSLYVMELCCVVPNNWHMVNMSNQRNYSDFYERHSYATRHGIYILSMNKTQGLLEMEQMTIYVINTNICDKSVPWLT